MPFLVLGVVHAFFTLHGPARGRPLSPADPQLAEAMSRTPLRLTRRTDMWKSWVGFNLSHSLGLLLLAIVVLLVGRSEAVFLREGPAFAPLALLVSCTYLALAAKYWFRTPILGVTLAAVLFLASWVLLLLA